MACCEYHCICGENFISNEKVCPKCGNTNVTLVGFDEDYGELGNNGEDIENIDADFLPDCDLEEQCEN